MPQPDDQQTTTTSESLHAVERPDIDVDGSDGWPSRDLHDEDRGTAGHLGRSIADLVHNRPWIVPTLLISAGSAAVTITLLLIRPWK